MFCRCCNLILQSKDHRDSHYAKGSCFPTDESLQKIFDRADNVKRKRHKRKRRKNKSREMERLRSSSVDFDDGNSYEKRRCMNAMDVPVIDLTDSPLHSGKINLQSLLRCSCISVKFLLVTFSPKKTIYWVSDTLP